MALKDEIRKHVNAVFDSMAATNGEYVVHPKIIKLLDAASSDAELKDVLERTNKTLYEIDHRGNLTVEELSRHFPDGI